MSPEDIEMIEHDLKIISKRNKEALKELDFAIEFAKSKGVITIDILIGIRRRLRGKRLLRP